jgi:5-hydroxyisourate hydrolase-like protein (transthyretin family)
MQRASSAQINVDMPDGSPAAGATAVLTNTDPTHQATVTTKVTDANGTALFPNLWEIKNVGYAYQLQITVPGYASSMTTSFPMESGGLNKVFNIMFTSGSWANVTVVDQSTGMPEVGATVSYVRPGGQPGTTTLTTDDSGKCTFIGLETGSTVFNVTTTDSPAHTGTTTKLIAAGVNAVTVSAH